jgi:hypothetical protein
MSKRANNLQETNYPLVSVQRFQSVKCDVNTRQVEELARYIAMLNQRREKPTEGSHRSSCRSYSSSIVASQVERRFENATQRPKAPAAQPSGD